jgi:hypothetical protein
MSCTAQKSTASARCGISASSADARTGVMLPQPCRRAVDSARSSIGLLRSTAITRPSGPTAFSR